MNRLALLPLLSCSLFAQHEIVRYAFDHTDSNQVLNLATGTLAAPSFAPATGSFQGTYTTGRFGTSLRHSGYMGMSGNRVYAGWQGGHQGAMTVAFWLRNGIANTPGQYSPVAGQPNWSIATGGAAGSGLRLSGLGAPDVVGNFGVALCMMPGWNHFAVVVDPVAATAIWYRNGAAATTTPIAAGMAAMVGELLVGTDHSTPCGSLYDIDEFVLLGRAASAGEIAMLAQTVAPAVVAFGVTDQVQLAAVQQPVLGNAAFALTVGSPTANAFVLAAGFSYASHGAVALPYDLGALSPAANGQLLLVAPAATVASSVAAGGSTTIPLAIPALPSLLAASFFAQVVAVPEGQSWLVSNALAVRLGSEP